MNCSPVAELPPVLIQKETAARLGVSVRTLNTWLRTGYGPAPTRIGGVLLYDRAVVEAFAAGAFR
jgi:DNA-binding transcriptional MerR regulator